MSVDLRPDAIAFAGRLEDAELEEGTRFAPRFDADGLIPVITTDADSGEVLMFAWMSADALRHTLASGEAWYWSRSRAELWHKGATSGQIQKLVEIRIDCDQDVLLLRVLPQKPGACHVGYRSCFYRAVAITATGETSLTFEETEKVSR